jgi:hypothetical protein
LVVVGAALEARLLVIESARGRQHQDARAWRSARQDAGDLVAVGSRDVAVEYHDVVVVEVEQFQGGVAIACKVCGDGLEPKAVADGLRQKELVFDDQYPHSPTVAHGTYRERMRNDLRRRNIRRTVMETCLPTRCSPNPARRTPLGTGAGEPGP